MTLQRQCEEFLAEKQRLSQALGLDKDPLPSVSPDTKSPMLLNIVNSYHYGPRLPEPPPQVL